MPKAVVDHNIFVTGMLSSKGASSEVMDRLRNGDFRLIYTTELSAELREVLSRPRMRTRYGVTAREIASLLKLLHARGRRVSISGKRRWCRDRDDDILCEAAVVGKAHYLVTNDDDFFGDADLVVSLRMRGVRVVRVAEFVDILRSAPVRLRRGGR